MPWLGLGLFAMALAQADDVMVWSLCRSNMLVNWPEAALRTSQLVSWGAHPSGDDRLP